MLLTERWRRVEVRLVSKRAVARVEAAVHLCRQSWAEALRVQVAAVLQVEAAALLLRTLWEQAAAVRIGASVLLLERALRAQAAVLQVVHAAVLVYQALWEPADSLERALRALVQGWVLLVCPVLRIHLVALLMERSLGPRVCERNSSEEARTKMEATSRGITFLMLLPIPSPSTDWS